jgi:hypothetical protein
MNENLSNASKSDYLRGCAVGPRGMGHFYRNTPPMGCSGMGYVRSPYATASSYAPATSNAPQLEKIKSGSVVGSTVTNLTNYEQAAVRNGAGSRGFVSAVEAAILGSTEPLRIVETEEITVNGGEKGLWINKDETTNWRGAIPISQYPINIDANPEVITKQVQQTVDYVQELVCRSLRLFLRILQQFLRFFLLGGLFRLCVILSRPRHRLQVR